MADIRMVLHSSIDVYVENEVISGIRDIIISWLN